MVRLVTATLYAVPASHPCAAIELALNLKGIPFRRVDMIPVLHKPLQRARFGSGTVPGLILDGEKHIGSRAIVRALEERVPEPPLLPADPQERKAVELAEEWGEQVLQPLARRVIWAALVRAPSAIPSYSVDSRLPIPAPVARLSAPLVARAELRIHRASDENVRADLAHLDRHAERVEGWIEEGALGGEQPNAADLQIGSGLALMLTLGDIAAKLDGRPAAELARRFFPDYPGSTPAGVLPAEWL
jgi:glutathione S-transferase